MIMQLIPRLKTTLLADSLVCFVFGALLFLTSLIGPSTLILSNSHIGGLSAELFVCIVGMAVLAIGLYVFWMIQHWPERIHHTYAVLAIEVVWCLGCVWLLAVSAQDFTVLGVALILASGIAVFVFLVLEFLGLRNHVAQNVRSVNASHQDQG
jgi:predicted RND superfamily exporter protein